MQKNGGKFQVLLRLQTASGANSASFTEVIPSNEGENLAAARWWVDVCHYILYNMIHSTRK